MIYLLVCIAAAVADRNQVIYAAEVGGSAAEPGKGYATDSQELSVMKCYDMKVSNISNVRGQLKLDQSMSQSQI